MRIRTMKYVSAPGKCFSFFRMMRFVAMACLVVAALGLILHDFPCATPLDQLHNVYVDSGQPFPSVQADELPVATLGCVSAEKVHTRDGVILLSSGLSPPSGCFSECRMSVQVFVV